MKEIIAQNTRPMECFKDLFLKYYEPLCLYSTQYVKDTDACKDIVADCFMRLWEKRERLDYSKSLKPLLYKSVHDKAIDYIRQASMKNLVYDESVESHPLDDKWGILLADEIDHILDYKLMKQEVENSLNVMSPRCATVFRMSREEGLSNKEIAESLGISVKGVEKNMTKALSTIRQHLISSGCIGVMFYAIFFSGE